MDSLRIQRTYTGKIRLERGGGTLDPLGDLAGRGVRPEDLEPLSEIIRELNERYGAELGPEDKVTLGRLLDQAEDNEALRLSVENNTEENANLAFEHAITGLLQQLVDTNFKLYKRISDDKDFSKHLMSSLFDQYRKRLANGGMTEEKVLEEIADGETKHRELKSSLRWNRHAEKKDDAITHAALKNIAAFMNTEGGVLYVGVGDNGSIDGIEQDGFANDDKWLLHLTNVVKSSMGAPAATRITARIWRLDGRSICRIECPPSSKPVYLKVKGVEKFYVRSGPSVEEMGLSDLQGYLAERFAG